MLIIWGKKAARANQGVIGRFCPFCRTVRVHDVTTILSVPHLYYVPLGGGEVQAIECACRGCRMISTDTDAAMWQPVRPHNASAYTIDTPQEKLCELAVATCAEDPEELLWRLELEDRQRAGQATEGERSRLILESIAAAVYMTFVKPGRSGQQSVTAVLQLLLIVGVIATLVLWGMLYQQQTRRTVLDFVFCGTVTVVTAGIAAIVVQRMRGATKMGVKAYVLEPVAKSLRSITPRVRVEELAHALEIMGHHGHPMSAAVTAEELMRQVEEGGK